MRPSLPPSSVLSRTVLVEEFAWRTSTSLAWVPRIEAFDDGCVIIVRFAARRGQVPREEWSEVCELDVTVDGVTPTELAFKASSGEDLLEAETRYWLSPLPAAAVLDLLVSWRGRGVCGSVVLDGTAIAEAAARARPYWP